MPKMCISEYPKIPKNIKELKEENNYYFSVLNEFTDNEDFVSLSDAEGVESKDYEGYFCIWYINNNKVCLNKILTYKTAHQVCENSYVTLDSHGYLHQVLKYLTRYHNQFKGKVIEIMYYESDNRIWLFKPYDNINDKNPYDKTGDLIITNISQNYKPASWTA